MKSVTILILLVLCLLGSLIFMESQFESISKEQGNAILEELKSIRQELNQIKQKGLVAQGTVRPAGPTSASVSTVGNPTLGTCKHPLRLWSSPIISVRFARGFIP